MTRSSTGFCIKFGMLSHFHPAVMLTPVTEGCRWRDSVITPSLGSKGRPSTMATMDVEFKCFMTFFLAR